MARQVNLKDMKLEAIGISNIAYDKPNRKMYSVQFYDYDMPDAHVYGRMVEAEVNTVLSIFPYDCLIYETKHGYHFISFALFETTAYTKAKALEMTALLKNQDYWCSQKDLILRFSPKWRYKRNHKLSQKVSNKPKFYSFLQEPKHCLISKSHLDFYFKFMELPLDVYEAYEECPSIKLDVKLYFYNARD